LFHKQQICPSVSKGMMNGKCGEWLCHPRGSPRNQKIEVNR
jgi:hypothetical protein